MTALPAVSKVVRIDHHFAQGNDPNIMIRLFMQYAGTLNVADATTWLTDIANAMKTFVNGILVNTLSLEYSELTDLSSPTSPQVVNASSQTGGNSNPSLPAGVSMVMSYEIARRYRGGKPRTYLPGMAQTALANPGLWDSGHIAVILPAWVTYLNTAATTPSSTAIGAINQVNVSYYEGFVNHTYPSGRVRAIPQLRATPLIDTIVAVKANPVPATQRRRNEQP